MTLELECSCGSTRCAGAIIATLNRETHAHPDVATVGMRMSRAALAIAPPSDELGQRVAATYAATVYLLSSLCADLGLPHCAVLRALGTTVDQLLADVDEHTDTDAPVH